MYHLKLIKGMSFTVGSLSASKKKPDLYVEDQEQAEMLVKTGRFAVVGETAEQDEDSDEEDGAAAETSDEDEGGEASVLVELQGMNKAELTEYAGKKGIDLSGCKTKDDILQRIVEALARAAEARESMQKA